MVSLLHKFVGEPPSAPPAFPLEFSHFELIENPNSTQETHAPFKLRIYKYGAPFSYPMVEYSSFQCRFFFRNPFSETHRRRSPLTSRSVATSSTSSSRHRTHPLRRFCGRCRCSNRSRRCSRRWGPKSSESGRQNQAVAHEVVRSLEWGSWSHCWSLVNRETALVLEELEETARTKRAMRNLGF